MRLVRGQVSALQHTLHPLSLRLHVRVQAGAAPALRREGGARLRQAQVFAPFALHKQRESQCVCGCVGGVGVEGREKVFGK